MRTRDSLLLKETDPNFANNNYGIKGPTIFGLLPYFMSGIYHFGFDELHGISNLAKLFFDMISPRYNANFKYHGNESNYPFQLSNASFECVKMGMRNSRKFIPTGAFQSSFKATDQSNVKGFYRSLDWIAWLIHVVPTLVVGQYDDLSIRNAILGLSRACALSLQWEVSKDDIKKIKSSSEVWFRCIDKLIQAKVLSNSVYTITMHHLHHIPQIIEQCSSLRNISVRSLEREIGNYKKKMRARVNVDKNAVNVLEQTTQYKFLESTKMLDCSSLYDRNPEYMSKGYIDHPATIYQGTNDSQKYPQLWQPFGDSFFLSDEPASSIEDFTTVSKFINALAGYKRRYLGISKNTNISINLHQCVQSASKLWFDSHIIRSALFKHKNISESSGANERGGEYIMFDSNIRKKVNRQFVPMPHWFVGKALFFFEANLDLVEGQAHGSLYAFVEVMKNHKTSPYSKYVPMVQPSREDETKKYAVSDVADIRTIAGLIQKTDIKNNRAESSNWYFVISPSSAFDQDMSVNAGKLSDLL
ncbi:hypothetical protein BD408DRAFT_434132 [Parasitella parasitica]|nr:hypothetical protein BD408DRAFT_434132 [Parasitella parasitica]